MKRRLVCALAVLVCCASGATRPADLRAHVEFLSSDYMEGRDTPSPGLDTAAQYISVQFRRAGLVPPADGTWFQEQAPGKRNVVGVLRGSDPALAETYVLVTAHYDHVGVCKPGEQDPVCNGANDNASGVASVIEIAARLAARRPRPKRTLVFIAYFGEEKGLVGSRYYAEHPLFPIESTIAQLNFEQTGRTDDLEGPNPRTLNVTGFDYSEVGILLAAAAPPGVRISKRPKWSDEAFERSDNEALAKKGVPAHTLAASFMFPDYHQPGDEWRKLDYRNMAVITDAAAAGVAAIANRPEAPRWYVGAPYGSGTSAIARPAPRKSKAAATRSRVLTTK
jgi:Zn-dependent M28 family amino/carboxypeptidase